MDSQSLASFSDIIEKSSNYTLWQAQDDVSFHLHYI